MKSKNLVSVIMDEVNKLVADHPDVPMFKKTMERLAAEMYELIEEGEFRKARTVVSKMETTVITFVNSLRIQGCISFVKATELKDRFRQFANAKRDELWEKARRKDDEETHIDDRHINEKLNEDIKKCAEMRKSMNQSSKPSKESTIIVIIMK